jgi:hypothetical protein
MSATVTAACKLPHGLTLRVFDMVETQEAVMGGGFRPVKMARELPTRITLKGVSHAQNAAPNAPMISGFALTHGVPKEFWDLWLAQNKDTDVVKNGLVFAHEKDGSTAAEAKEKEKVRSGLERLDPKALPKSLAKIEAAKG